MQASLCFFLAIIVLVQMGNAYPKNKGSGSKVEEKWIKQAAFRLKGETKNLKTSKQAGLGVQAVYDCCFNRLSKCCRDQMRKPGPVQKNEAKTDVIRQKEAQIGSLMRQKQTV